MKKAFKKAISILLVAVMVFGAALFAGFVNLDLSELNLFSFKAEAATSGTCGKNLTWSLDLGTGVLTISGTGLMNNYFDLNLNYPWYRYRSLIKSVTIADGVTSIGEYAFWNCTSLKSVTIGNGVISIGKNAFFKCANLADVTIGNGVTSIGESAFYVCTNLASITIPASVTSIGESAFNDCTSLASVTVNSDNTAYLNDEYGALFNKDKTELIQYPVGNARTNYVIPDSVTTIGYGAFLYCTSLTSVIIPQNVTSIGIVAFSGCTNLASITIPKSLTVIGSDVFPGCDNIKDIYYEGSRSDWENFRIGSNNGTLATAKVHYNYKYDNSGATDTPEYDSSDVDTSLMPTPTETTISYGDSIVLHVDPSKIPEGGYVEWTASNENFSYSVSVYGTTCTITPDKKGDTTFTAIVYDAEGNIVSADTQTMTSKAGFFDKIIAFFKKLFGLTKTIPEAVKGIY